MEDFIKEALSSAVRQVPSLVVVAVVVWMFVKVIFRFIKHIEDRGNVMEGFHREQIDERQATRAVMEHMTEAISRLTRVVEQFKNHIE